MNGLNTSISVVLLLAVTRLPAVEVRVERLDGTHARGQLVAVAPEGVTVSTDANSQLIQRDRLMRLEVVQLASPESQRLQNSVAVGLLDGSALVAADLNTFGGRAEILLLGGGAIQASTRSIKWVQLMPHNQALQQQWQAILDGQRASDTLVIRKTSAGTDPIAPADTVLDEVQGVIGDISSTHVQFDYDGTPVALPRARVDGVIYRHPEGSAAGSSICVLQDTAGGRWVATSLELVDRELHVTTGAGVRAVLPLDRLAAIDYALGNVSYLVDLPTDSIEFEPRVGGAQAAKLVADWFKPRTERGEIKLGQRTFNNSLSIHSRSVVTYRLREEHRRLLATARIDDRFRPSGQVRLEIRGGERVLLEREIVGDDDPVDLDVDIRGVRRLTLIVDFGADEDDRGDHLILFNPRLTK